MKPCKPLAAWLLALLSLFCFPLSALAAGKIDTEKDICLTVCYQSSSAPLIGAPFSLYLVATVDAYAELTVADAFAPYAVDLSLQNETAANALAETLEGYVLRDKIPALDDGQTDANGLLHFPTSGKSLTPGLYLVLGDLHTQNGSVYRSAPCLVLLPAQNSETNQWDYSLTAYPKHTATPVQPEPTSYQVIKIWNDGGANASRPRQITVDLLKDGAVYDSVTLSERNNWRHTWQTLDPAALWSVAEQTPAGYTVSLSKEGTAFVLTNTRTAPTPSAAPPAKLPQTGQLWWPVPALVCLGVLCLILHLALKKGKSDET